MAVADEPLDQVGADEPGAAHTSAFTVAPLDVSSRQRATGALISVG